MADADVLATLEVRTIAPTARQVDRDLERVERRVERIERATARKARADAAAERQLAQMTQAIEQLGRALGVNGRDVAAVERALRQLEARERAVGAAMQLVGGAANDNSRALTAAAQASQRLATTGTALTATATAATRSGAAVAASARTATAATGSFRAFGGAMQLAAFQVGDFFVQLASGQGIIRPLVQQGAQLAGAFGPIGAVVGAAGAAIGALFLTLGEAKAETQAAERATARLGEALGSAKQEAQDAAQAESILAEALDRAKSSTSDLTDSSFARVTALRQQQEAALSLAQTEVDAAAARLKAIEIQIEAQRAIEASAFGEVDAPRGAPPELTKAKAEYDRLAETVRILTAEIERLKGAQADLFDRDFREPLQAAVDYQRALTKALGQGAEAVRKVQIQEAIRVEQARAGVKADSERGKAIADLVRQREEQIDVNERLTEAQREAAAEAKRRADEEGRLAGQRAETIADLETELTYVTELRRAHLEGAEAVATVESARRAYLITQRLKLAGDSEEAAKIAALVVQIDEQRAAIDRINEGQRAVAREAERSAADADDIPAEVEPEFNALIAEALT